MLMERMPDRLLDTQEILRRGVRDNLHSATEGVFLQWYAHSCHCEFLNSSFFAEMLYGLRQEGIFLQAHAVKFTKRQRIFQHLPRISFPLSYLWMRHFRHDSCSTPETSSIFCAIWKKLVIASEQAHLVEFQDIAELSGAIGMNWYRCLHNNGTKACRRWLSTKKKMRYGQKLVFLIDSMIGCD